MNENQNISKCFFYAGKFLGGIILVAVLLAAQAVRAQNGSASSENKKRLPVEKTRILFILDASQSMLGNWQGEEKYKIARILLSNVLDSLKNIPGADYALRVYGHQHQYPPQVCNDSRLEVPFGSDRAIDRIKYRLKHITPKGTSPIAASLAMASSDFTPCSHCRNVVILITDGKEECGGDICEVSARLQKQGVIFKPFIIGIGNDFRKSFDCAGTYFNAADKKQFSDALKMIVTRVLSKTTMQVNLLDKNGKPLETNVNMQFIDKVSGQVRYNFIHTLNAKGVPDTVIIDPLPHYRLIINTLPPVVVDEVHLSEGKHNIVAAKTPQGIFSVNTGGVVPPDFNPPVEVRDIRTHKLINVQYAGQQVKYLAGKYEIDILTLPPMHRDTFEIKADFRNNINIESPGILVVGKNFRVYGTIFRLERDGQHFVVNLNENLPRQESFYLQPGKYRLVYRSRFQTQSLFTVSRDFEIKANKTTHIRF